MRRHLLVACVVASSLGGVGPKARAQAPDARDDYRTFCRSCHGDQGKGDGFAARSIPMPDFTESEFQRTRDDARLARAIREGGKAVGASPMMMPFGKKLSAAQIDALVGLIRGFGDS